MTEAAWSNLVVLEARPGREKFLEEALTQFTLRCRQEEGCLQYDCFQSFENPGRFLLQIRFKDEVSLKVHLTSAALREFLERLSLDLAMGSPETGYQRFSGPG